MCVSFQSLLAAPVLVVPHSNRLVIGAADDDLAPSRMEQQPPHPIVVTDLSKKRKSHNLFYMYIHGVSTLAMQW